MSWTKDPVYFKTNPRVFRVKQLSHLTEMGFGVLVLQFDFLTIFWKPPF